MELFHLHNDYEIYFLLEGKRKYIIKHQEYNLDENSLVFINKNILHKTCGTGFKYKRFVLNFYESYVSNEVSYLINLLFENGPTILNVPNDQTQPFLELLKAIQKEYVTDQLDSSLYIQSLLTQLLIVSKRLYYQQSASLSTTRENTSVDSELISSIIKYIHEHFRGNLPLSRLAQTFHWSENYLSRLFSKGTGFKIIQYLNTIRIIEARRLLRETEIKVNDVAKNIGFANHGHFCRVFKKEVGRTPTQFREDNKR